MSITAAMKFLERVEREETLRTQLYVSNPKTFDDLLQFAHGKGFVLSAEELRSALQTYEEKFPTGTIEPLKKYLDETPRLSE